MKSFLKKTNEHKVILILALIIVILASIIAIYLAKMDNEKKEICNSNNCEINFSVDDNFVFLGDSITDYYPLEELYDGIPVINSGVSGYNTTDILNNVDKMVTIYNPTKVIILIGTNDIRKEIKNEEILANIDEIVNRILKKRPKAKIYIQSVYPVNNTDHEVVKRDVVGDRSNEVIMDLNKRIKKLCDDKGYTYINMYDKLVDKDGNLEVKYTTDGLHISNTGYLKITKTLYRYLNN